MNSSDSERVASVLERIGYERAGTEREADMLIFNTCQIKQKAEDKLYGLRKNLEKLHDENTRLKVAVTGCMVRDSSTRNAPKDHILKVMDEVDFVFRIEDVAKLPDLLREVDPALEFEDGIEDGTLENYFKINPKKTNNYSVFVPISQGCDKFCTYCIVPYTRGREASRDFDEIVAECAKHVDEGALEITLVGQTVNSYGLSFNDKKSGKFEKHGKNPFSALLRAVDKLSAKGLSRLRFTSPHPRDFHDELIQTMAELKTICPYVHMPVQSGDDAVLRRMNRNYRTPEYKEIMNKLKKAIPNIAISTDIIVGFCGETEAEFHNTLNMYREMEWDFCYNNKYSSRKGTYAQKRLTDDVPPAVKTERWHSLNEVLKEISRKKHAAFIGKEVEVLVEQQIGQTCIGRSRENKEVTFKSGRKMAGKLANVRVTDSGTFQLRGELISPQPP